MIKDPIHICILGAGFGGLYTALYLSRFSWVKSGQCQITLVEPKEHFLFTPLLYELITGELQRWEIAPSYEKLLSKTKIYFCQQTVAGVDLKTRQVSLDNGGTLVYDYLVLSVGSQNSRGDVPGATTYALTFRTLADVERLQGKLRLLEASERQSLRLAVIGGGPSGVELACKLADRLGRRGQIHLIERGEEILKNFSAGVRKAACRSLSARRVLVDCQTSIKAIAANQITLEQGQKMAKFPVDLVIWTAGTQVRDWIQYLDCQQTPQGKLLTTPTLQLVDYPEVFALGDLAQICNGKKPVPATAQAAYQQASCAAKNLKALLQGNRLKRFHYLHLGDMLTLGKGAAIVSSFCLNLEGAFAALLRRLIYIQRLPTSRHRLQVLNHLLVSTWLKIWRWMSRHLRQFTHKSARSYFKSSEDSRYRR